MRTALITGICGQDGYYLAEFLLKRRYRVVGLVRPERARTEPFGTSHSEVEIVPVDLLDERQIRSIVKKYAPHEIYNLAARASSAQLFTEPLLTADINGLAVVRLLESIRMIDPTIRFFQASSSELFGDAVESPQNERTPLRPRNPYGVAKLFAHGMVEMYRERFGVFACSGILFNHESPRRSSEHVTRKVTMAVARIRAGLTDSLRLGRLEATRDWGYAGDYVRAMWQILQASSPNDYVIATGKSHSVRELCETAFGRVGLDYQNYVQCDANSQRPIEQVPLVGDATRLRSELGWKPTVPFEQLVHLMVDADVERLTGAAV